MAKIQITPELIANLIPLPDGVAVGAVGFDHKRGLVTAELEGEGVPNREIVSVILQAIKKDCGCLETGFVEFR